MSKWICWVLVIIFCLPHLGQAFQSPDLAKRAQDLLQEGQQLLLLGHTDRANALIQEARSLQKKLAKQYFHKGLASMQKGDLNTAKLAFEQSLENNYTDAACHAELGNVYFRQKNYAPALTHTNKSLTLDPTLTYARDLLAQIQHAFLHKGAVKTYKNYTFPCQIITFQEGDSLRVEIAYALPKVGLTRAGGVGAVHLDQVLAFIHPVEDFRHVFNTQRLPEHGHTPLEKNYLLATHTLNISPRTTDIHLKIKDNNIGSLGTYQTPCHLPAQPFMFGMSHPLLARSITTRKDHPQKREDLSIVPNPLRIYQSHTPLYVYIELYNLLSNTFGQTDFELSYQIQWPEASEISVHLFEALDTQFTQTSATEISQPAYLIPHKHRQNKQVDAKAISERATSITIPYSGTESNDLTYLEIDISHLIPGIHKLVLKGRDLVAQEEIVHTTLFRLIK